MKFLKIVAFLIAASVGSATVEPIEVPDSVDLDCRSPTFFLQTRTYTTVKIKRRCRTEGGPPITATSLHPTITSSSPHETTTELLSTAPPFFERTSTDKKGRTVIYTVTEPLTITTTGVRTITEYGTVRTTVTDLTLVETICTATTTHTNKVGVTVTEIVRYTSTVEIVGDSTVPYNTGSTSSESASGGSSSSSGLTTSEDMSTGSTSTDDAGRTVTSTDSTGGIVTFTVTQPLTITTTGVRTVTEYGTVKTTVTDLTLVETICTATTTHTDEVGVTVTEIVRYTSTVEIVGDSTVPYDTKQTWSSSHDTIINGDTGYGTSHMETMTRTSREVQDITSDGNKLPSNSNELTTRATSTADPTDGSDTTTTPEGSSDTDFSSSLTAVKTSRSDGITATSSDRGGTPLDTNCPISGLPLSDDEKTMIDVIFNSGIGGTTYAQWLVNYASQLLTQVDNVSVHAMIDPNGQYTSAFDFINISGILGLASAAPMYDCFLSSLWAEALRDPSAYAKRDGPSQDEKTKLVVLFERRSDSNGDYNLAELLFDETDNLLAEMKSVIAGQPLDLEMLNGGHLLAVALNAPIATEGLNDAILSAINSNLSTKRLDTLESLPTTGELPSATGSGDVPTPGFPVTTFVSETSDLFTPTIPEATGGGDVPTSSLPVVTFTTETSSDSTWNLPTVTSVTEAQ